MHDIGLRFDDGELVNVRRVEITGNPNELRQLSLLGYGEFSIIDLEKPKRDLEALRKAAMFI
jgi:hypothetical protein